MVPANPGAPGKWLLKWRSIQQIYSNNAEVTFLRQQLYMPYSFNVKQSSFHLMIKGMQQLSNKYI